MVSRGGSGDREAAAAPLLHRSDPRLNLGAGKGFLPRSPRSTRPWRGLGLRPKVFCFLYQERISCEKMNVSNAMHGFVCKLRADLSRLTTLLVYG